MNSQQLYGAGSVAPMPQNDAFETIRLEDTPSTKFTFLAEQGAAMALQYGNLYLGVNALLEQELDPGFFVKDLFVYDLSLSYPVGDFSLNFMCENFLNLNQKEAGILPEVIQINGVVHQTSYGLDSPFLVALGVSFTF